ncbi:sugar ABC transporter substrate-binding protein [Alicyclobacillus tolerans]|uniref:ABC transporter substrate-binding protein n=1 Tax=Alicyclobacillus tolerans TaxID=90970 RepID=UPI001F34AE05|nr:sugar ABC transporter substrate-binding protein [Alicyclobacillus tolerans]MCF8567958.1 sugar ABC transporter substrate-binding protein [Alicyclobacillus tolerans]
MKAKGLFIGSTSILLTLGLVGCGAASGGGNTSSTGNSSNSGSSSKPVTIQFWDMQQSSKNINQAEQQAIQEFEKQNPNIKVNLTVIPYQQYQDKLLVAVKGGTAPDVATLDEVWTSQFAAAGAIQPLDSYVNSSSSTLKPNMFFKGAWNTVQWNNKIWAVPLSFDVWEQLYYNVDMFKKAGISGPPKTWTEFLADAKKLTHAPNQFGVGLIGHKGEDTSVMLDSLLYSNGGQIVNSSGKVVLDSPQNIQTLKFFKQLSQYAPNGVANASEGDTDNLFTSGKVAMILDGDWSQDTVKSQAPNMNWKIAVPPAPSGHTFVGALGGWNLALFKTSKHPNAAWKFMEFLSQKKVETAVNSLIPARVDAGQAFVQANRKQPNVIMQTLQSGKPRPISPVYPQLSDIEQNMVQNIWSGTPIDKAVASAAKQMTTTIQQN